MHKLLVFRAGSLNGDSALILGHLLVDAGEHGFSVNLDQPQQSSQESREI